ncbi:MAG: MBL fold metallo-hydrolase [Bacteroidetes bacterium]|nr:MAG: MBL fold metallo-hydrolase [Bacteroidota bacterium]
MKITFLGTGTSQGIPVVACPCDVCHSNDYKDNRLRTSVLVETANQRFTIDAGPDFRYQMLREEVKHLDAILITHSHKDHIGGLDDVRSFNYLQKSAMDIYVAPFHQKEIIREYSYAFQKDLYPGVPNFNLIDISQAPFYVGNVKIIPLPVLHMKMEVTGFRIGDFAYITDTNYIPGSILAQLLDCKVIVLNALRKRKHPSHYSLKEAVSVLKFLRPERAYITHISHLMGFHKEVCRELPDFIELAHDGLQIEV